MLALKNKIPDKNTPVTVRRLIVAGKSTFFHSTKTKRIKKSVKYKISVGLIKAMALPPN